VKSELKLLNQREVASGFGVSTNAFRNWDMPSVSRNGRERLYDAGVCMYVRIGQRVAEGRKLDTSGPIGQFALGFASARQNNGTLDSAEVNPYLALADRVGFHRNSALIALGDAGAALGVIIRVG